MNINQYGYRLVSQPSDVPGYPTFVILDKYGGEVASIDRPCTLEEALTAAREFVAKELEEKAEIE